MARYIGPKTKIARNLYSTYDNYLSKRYKIDIVTTRGFRMKISRQQIAELVKEAINEALEL